MNLIVPVFHVPTPTEYKGIVFRSKSEAVVARGFDLTPNLLWEYEPENFKTEDKWVPDFLVAWTGGKNLFAGLVEYKPSDPTESYRELLLKRVAEFSENELPLIMIILVGNPFDPTKPRFQYVREAGRWETTTVPFLFRRWDEALKYRFDLKQ